MSEDILVPHFCEYDEYVENLSYKACQRTIAHFCE